MKNKILQILFLVSISIFSCKDKENKKAESIETEVVKKTNIDKKNAKRKEKKLVFKKDSIIKARTFLKIDTIIKTAEKKEIITEAIDNYPLIIDKDTLSLGNFDYSKSQEFSIKCEGKINEVEIFYLKKFKKSPLYIYALGNNPKLIIKKDNYTIKYLTIFLIKSNSVVDTINIKNYANKHYVVGLGENQNISIEGLDEIINFGYGQGFCGGDYGDYLFFRKKDKLIKGINTGGFGEPETNFYSQEIIPPKDDEKNQIWVENKYGGYDNKDNKIIYVKYFEKYEVKNNSLVLLNPKKNEVFYVTAEKGLSQRSSPNVNSRKLSKLEFGTEVKVLNKTLIGHSIMDNGTLIKNNWMQIENSNKNNPEPCYVFGGYLSKNNPKK